MHADVMRIYSQALTELRLLPGPISCQNARVLQNSTN